MLTHRSTGLGVEVRARGLLNDFLVATLNGALALVQVERVAKLVTKNLHLDVAGIVHKLFHEQTVVTKAGLGLCLGQTVRFLDLFVVPIFSCVTKNLPQKSSWRTRQCACPCHRLRRTPLP